MTHLRFSICIYTESYAPQQISVLTLMLTFHILRAALAETSRLYDSIDDSLHRLVRVSNQRSHELEALSRLATLVDKLDKVL